MPTKESTVSLNLDRSTESGGHLAEENDTATDLKMASETDLEEGMTRNESMRSRQPSMHHIKDERMSTKVGQGVKFNITFEDLSYGVYLPKQKEPKWLLKNVTGAINPKQMTALMGPSGAGKSTLLEVLAGRKQDGEIEGELLFNGKERTRAMKRWFGFVEQRDSLIATMTVRETLMYTARLRIKANGIWDKEDHADQVERVDEILDMLGLTACADVVIGDENNRGVSGGQAKRANAAMELITSPSILFLDEPTSGLDSATSLDFIRCIKDIAARGVSVICTIHQPSEEVYGLFDRLLLLVAGEVVYLGKANMAVSYFQDLGFKKAPGQNPADFLVSVTSGHKPTDGANESKTWPDVDPNYFAQEYMNSQLATDRKESTLAHRSDISGQVDTKDKKELYANGFVYNVVVLIERNWCASKRDKSFFFKRVFSIVIVATAFMLAYLMPGFDDAAIRGKQSVLMLSMIIFLFTANGQVDPTVERRNYMAREVNAGSYSVSAHFWSTVLFEVPWTFFKLFILYSGFFIQYPDIPVYWIWAYYISHVNYSMAGLLLNEFKGKF
ncbi:hypothetical protein, variant [Sphaeroforma arctica JP610]|uniref:ABC transporter domain-containing protein n=1 Tax=Sphaeroforma arctica JP610 TaxID=667725 RepID=A0A0L0FR73_9EUKA|nr:hypothetical protein, variant [Sphaeroforma arctica JP610]KNC79270.1 hypothetical protein, variant [Sphaeroforma arctica JP610]|eukprot:XP_014153172.1 hypothetical protein, variant [Sphaeroforma arctica JP610]